MITRLVTIVGAGPGVGMAVARRFAREGHPIALIARNANKLATLVPELNVWDVPVEGIAADAGDALSLRSAIAKAHDAMGQTGVLVYNAHMGLEGVPSQLDPETLASSLNVNLIGALVAAQEVIPTMRDEKQGTLLFTGGGLALKPRANYSALAAGKAALRNLAYSLYEELKPDGIHAATVTIAGYVRPGGYFDPDKIAEKYWELHNQAAGSWQPEIIYAEPQD